MAYRVWPIAYRRLCIEVLVLDNRHKRYAICNTPFLQPAHHFTDDRLQQLRVHLIAKAGDDGGLDAVDEAGVRAVFGMGRVGADQPHPALESRVAGVVGEHDVVVHFERGHAAVDEINDVTFSVEGFGHKRTSVCRCVGV
jgi:hypothetical protein